MPYWDYGGRGREEWRMGEGVYIYISGGLYFVHKKPGSS